MIESDGGLKPYEQVAAEKDHAYEMYAAVCEALGFPQHWMQGNEVVVNAARKYRALSHLPYWLALAALFVGFAGGWVAAHAR